MNYPEGLSKPAKEELIKAKDALAMASEAIAMAATYQPKEDRAHHSAFVAYWEQLEPLQDSIRRLIANNGIIATDGGLK